MNQQPLVSIIVIGRNEGDRLARCLKSIHQIHQGSFQTELIYVDSASTDQSVIVANEHGAKVVEINPKRPCAAVGRNAGLAIAHGDYVLFLDGDTILHPDFLQKALQAICQPHVAVVWGHRREMNPNQSIYVKAMDLDWIYKAGVSEFCGGDALMKTYVLRSVGGFNDTLIAGEEPELCRRIRQQGYVILHIDAPMTLHDLAIHKFSAYWKRAFRAGHAYAEISNRFKDSDDPLWKADARKNMVRGSLYIGALIALVFSGIVPLLLPLLACGFAAITARTYRQCRWKSDNQLTLWLYALHSHFQQIPILCGQLSFYWHRQRGIKKQLVNYK